MKTVIVTDPCYLITDRDWSGMCNECFNKEQGDDGLVKFRDRVQELLRVISGDETAVAGDTGFGDWQNEIDEKMFYADSGMVCVVELTEKLEKYMEKWNVHPSLGVAYLTVYDDAKYRIDTTDPQWSVVWVESEREVFHSLLPE